MFQHTASLGLCRGLTETVSMHDHGRVEFRVQTTHNVNGVKTTAIIYHGLIVDYNNNNNNRAPRIPEISAVRDRSEN